MSDSFLYQPQQDSTAAMCEVRWPEGVLEGEGVAKDELCVAAGN